MVEAGRKPTPEAASADRGRPRTAAAALLLPLVVVALGLVVAAGFIATAPVTRTEDKERPVRIVQVAPLARSDAEIRVTAYGTVTAARQLVVKPQVGGQVIRHHNALVPGGRIGAGEELVGIDPADYQLALEAHQAALEEAAFALEIERGQGVVASREWALLGNDLAGSEVNRSLVLREPHLRRAQALVTRARNAIARAQLDLDRTAIAAPFNALVLEEAVEVGQLVEPGDAICTLVGTDAFWVRATVPAADLYRLDLPEDGEDSGGRPAAEVLLDTGRAARASWPATVEGLLGDLEPRGRMARLLLRVPDPLGPPAGQGAAAGPGAGAIPLLIGSYVRVEIDAGRLEGVFAVPRRAVREGGKIWVVDALDQVQVRDAEVAWRQGETDFVRADPEPGDRLVVGGLRTALPGMAVDPQPAPGDR